MTMIAPRSSTTASDSRNTRALEGRFDAVSARTPSANAMSVATGIAHARSIPGVPQPTPSATSAGTIIPPIAATIGSTACLNRDSSPMTSSRLSSSPATKKKIASRPSFAQSPMVRFRWSSSGPSRNSRSAW